jgi:hypothetical protein
LGCPICELMLERDRLLAADEAARAASNVRTWIAEYEQKTTVTIYGALGEEHKRRLLALLIEIEST